MAASRKKVVIYLLLILHSMEELFETDSAA